MKGGLFIRLEESFKKEGEDRIEETNMLIGYINMKYQNIA
jgi:hypothetical protein